MGGGLGRVTNHPDYYLIDGSVSFLTGNTLFRVHRSFLERESKVFSDLFAHAAEENPHIGTDACPFTLDVTPSEFAIFLWVWYDTEYSYRRQTKDNWIVILRLASRWEFPKIKELAVRELEALDLPPAERISIYNQYGIDGEQLLSSYVELCRSPTVPTAADGHLLQMETLVNVLQAREDAQRKAAELGHETPTSASLEGDTLREIIAKYFKIGLNLWSDGTSTGSEVQASSLNGERPPGTGTSATITVKVPQVPDRDAQSAPGPTSHANSSPQTGSGGKGDREKEQENQAESNNARDKEREKKAKQEKEKARQDKEKEEREKKEKAKQEKEKEAREKAQKAEEQKPSVTPRGGRGRGN